jgi:hypothetical protein
MLLLAHHVSSCPKLSWARSKTGGWTLTLLTTLACLCLGLAWAYEADYVAMVFAAEAAFAGVEATAIPGPWQNE